MLRTVRVWHFAVGFGTALVLAVVVMVLGARPAMAAPPLPTPTPFPEYGCRGCHGETNRTYSFPSGEIVSVDVDLETLDSSPHTSAAMHEPVACLGCHNDEIDHRYPHLPVEEATRRDYALRVSESCEGCHFPHKPFHTLNPGEDPADQNPVDPSLLPGCVDCHGSHNIARVEEIGEVMPAYCLACHTNESTEWAEEHVKPREGFGAGALGYGGSTRCNGCHDDKYFTWQQTLHARLILGPDEAAAAVPADFDRTNPHRTFAFDDVGFAVGSRWRQVFVSHPVSGTFPILPAQWNVAAAKWAPYAASEGGTTGDWLKDCSGCHVTGLNTGTGSGETDTATWGFTEFAVGCESCHGPAAEHAADPENVKPHAEADSQVCGACHSRGTSPDGHPFPTTFVPGEQLADHFSPASGETLTWPDGSARLNGQQYTDWMLGNTMAEDDSITCATCHEVHGPGVEPGQLRLPVNELCLECHNEQRAIIAHMPYHEQAAKSHDFTCSDCHMPKLATSVAPFDIHSHAFHQPNPQGSIDLGGLDVMPNACNQCHTELGEGADWAVQMIAWTEEQSGQQDASFFGPGPTPTSPPLPTPLPGVGQEPYEEFQVGTGRWLRIGMFAGAGLLGAVVIVAAARTVMQRRRKHV